MSLLYLCVKIFCGRLIDVSLSTLQTMFLVKGKRNLATIFGFIDVFIWFLVVREALSTDVQSIWIAVAYAGGFAAGTYLGSAISKSVIKGTVSVQVITKNIKNCVTESIKLAGYSASVVKCTGIHDEDTNYMIYAQVNNRKLEDFKKLVTNTDKNAFITVTESKEILNGYFSK
ncbi:MAG: DUF2179 domain-containing protein [Bacilli bacterium]|nr:DUF2179 domain-containing protein [Bacilli bacterium]